MKTYDVLVELPYYYNVTISTAGKKPTKAEIEEAFYRQRKQGLAPFDVRRPIVIDVELNRDDSE